MRKIILVGILPPPFNGQSLAFKVLADNIKSLPVSYKIIDIAGSYRISLHIPSIFRKFDFVVILTKLFFSCMFSKNVVYVQIAQGRNGFLRDRMINKIAGLFNCKIVAHMHGGNYNGFYESQDLEMKQVIEQEVLKYDKIIVLSDNLKRMFDFQPLLQSRIVSIPNGIDQSVHHATGKDIAGLVRTKMPVVILYLSNLIYSKGYMEVLKSLHLLKLNGTRFKAFFCGQFDVSTDPLPYKSVLEARADFFRAIEEYGLQEEVVYKGVVTGEHKSQLLKEAHFFVLPTRYPNEGQPVSIIEAMRNGCVVVASNYRGIPEMIKHEETGLLLNEISPESIAAYIIGCLNNPALYSAISGNAIQYYNNHFTEKIHSERMMQLLLSCSKS